MITVVSDWLKVKCLIPFKLCVYAFNHCKFAANTILANMVHVSDCLKFKCHIPNLVYRCINQMQYG